ncbi:MAG: penicillin-binding transpeptidase domain-containing protein [Candidatus Shapirobacteria bacterium]
MKRLSFFYFLLFICFLLFLVRLIELQLIFGGRYRALADGNRIRQLVIPAPRGLIYDRNDQPLVANRPLYRLCESEDKCQEISRDEALKLQAEGSATAEQIRLSLFRYYPFGRALAHVLGYLDHDGQPQTGLEKYYHDWLEGQDGGELIEVDTFGQRVRDLGRREALPGRDLYLSLDANLSKIAFEALAGYRGAIVVTEAKTGQVLALASSPSFDPNQIEPSLLSDEDKPFFNRALSGAYPPGSIFKIITAAAGLEEGKIKGQTLYTDEGVIRVGDFVYRNWYFTQYGRTEGAINVVRALTRSTDTFFYKVGEWLGAEALIGWAEKFSLGNSTGIDLPAESTGHLPSLSQKFYLGNLYHLAIGQGDLLITPLQANLIAVVIATDGRLCLPKIQSGESTCQDLDLKKETLDLIKEGMIGACSSGGTAYPLFDFQPRVACKTGTAEYGDKEGKTHAWLVAFAPVDEPQIVVSVLVEGGGEGSSVAAPMAKKILEAWFRE